MSPSKRPDCTLSFSGDGRCFLPFSGSLYPRVLKLVLIAGPHIVHHFIKTLDNVEGINADPGVWKVLPGDRDKAVAHVAAEVFYPFPLLWRELMEIVV